MRLDVFRGKVRKDQPIEVDVGVSELRYALRRHFYNRIAALGAYRLAQKSLAEKTSRHGHFKQVWFRVRADFKADRACDSCGVSRLFENCIYKLGNGRIFFGAGYADDGDTARRQAIEYGSEKGKRVVIGGLQSSKQGRRNKRFKKM